MNKVVLGVSKLLLLLQILVLGLLVAVFQHLKLSISCRLPLTHFLFINPSGGRQLKAGLSPQTYLKVLSGNISSDYQTSNI